ncbi:hypothetical protein [Streptomyces huasconensis]
MDHRQILGDRYYAYLETFAQNAQAVQDLPNGSGLDHLNALAYEVHTDLCHLLRMDMGQHADPAIAAKLDEAAAVTQDYPAQEADYATVHQHACRAATYVRLLVRLAQTPRAL